MYQMMVKSTIVQYDRLHRILEKTKKDHALYRQQTEAAAKRAEFPTQEMIDRLESELNSFRFSYLPVSSDAKSKDLSADELDKTVTAIISHLKGDLIPKLKQIQN